MLRAVESFKFYPGPSHSAHSQRAVYLLASNKARTSDVKMRNRARLVLDVPLRTDTRSSTRTKDEDEHDFVIRHFSNLV